MQIIYATFCFFLHQWHQSKSWIWVTSEWKLSAIQRNEDNQRRYSNLSVSSTRVIKPNYLPKTIKWQPYGWCSKCVKLQRSLIWYVYLWSKNTGKIIEGHGIAMEYSLLKQLDAGRAQVKRPDKPGRLSAFYYHVWLKTELDFWVMNQWQKVCQPHLIFCLFCSFV